MTLNRLSGLLLHVTSLPSPYGMGDLGPSAYRFAEFLEERAPTKELGAEQSRVSREG
jgi:4-alpha-glucanotransferase